MVIQNSATDTRNKILSAALKLFSTNGFHATTTRLIAKSAGVNEVTLFRLFKTKLQLFGEILEHIKEIGFDSKRLLEVNMQPRESIRFVIENFFETFEDNPQEFRVMFHAVLDEVEKYETEFIGNHQAKLVAFLTQAFKTLWQTHPCKTVLDPKMHAQVLISTLLGLVTGRILTKTLPIKHYQRQEICNHVAELFLNC